MLALQRQNLKGQKRIDMHNTIMESTNCIKKVTELLSRYEGSNKEMYERRFNADSREFKEKLLEIKGLE